MQRISERPLFTQVIDELSSFKLESGSHYFMGKSVEERSEHWKQWQHDNVDVQYLEVIDRGLSEMEIVTGDGSIVLPLRNEADMLGFLSSLNSTRLYIDITGLPHHVWAALLKASVGTRAPVSAAYAEPGDYRFSSTPTEGEIFDLSERILGIAPLPGFARLSRFDDDSAVFVPLLGFEGARLSYVLESVQPAGANTFPIVGVPGFRVEYPFFTYLGNKSQLVEDRRWANIRFARANCPFSLYYVLEDIIRDHPGQLFKIAPIGTKPHALGAVLFFLNNSSSVELVYDHPIRKSRRTEGMSRLCLYDLTCFLPRSS